MIFFVLVAVAVIVGILGSLLGVGGGILIVPILTLFLDVPVKNAIGTSLVCVVSPRRPRSSSTSLAVSPTAGWA